MSYNILDKVLKFWTAQLAAPCGPPPPIQDTWVRETNKQMTDNIPKHKARQRDTSWLKELSVYGAN